MPTDLQIESPPEKPGDLPPSPPGLPLPLPHQVKPLPVEAAGKTEKRIQELVNKYLLYLLEDESKNVLAVLGQHHHVNIT